MVYICLACGNREEFRGYVSGRCSYTERVSFDGDGGVTDTDSTDYDDYDSDNTEVEECSCCGSNRVEYYDTEEDADEAYKTNGKGKPKTLMSLEVKDDS